jgi:hypothetical protein
MGFEQTRENRKAILLRCEELQSDLKSTKDRLNQAASQLEELTKILLERRSGSHEILARPWLKDLAISQLIEDVLEAERRLVDARASAAKLGIPIPTNVK